jgi:hypothetical protein
MVLMKKQTVLAKKRRGPAPTGKGIQVVVRMQPPALALLDTWIEDQSDKPSRPEAIRRILEKALAKRTTVKKRSKRRKKATPQVPQPLVLAVPGIQTD